MKTTHIFAALIALCPAAPVAAATVPATCDTISAALTKTAGGDTIRLVDVRPCSQITITKVYPKRLTLDLRGSTVDGIVVQGKPGARAGNVTIKGGRIRAKGGMDGFAGDGYGVLLRQATRVTVQDGVGTGAKNVIVVDNSDNIRVAYMTFTGYRADGIIASMTDRITITRNRFGDQRPKPTSCTAADGSITYSVPSRDCLAPAVWKDGTHADLIQMRNGVSRATISYNFGEGETQGITQMDTTGDLPLRDIRVEHNTLRTSGPHAITLGKNCTNCSIQNNDVGRGPGSTWKAVIIPGAATRCGNVVPDDKTVEPTCTEVIP